MRFLNDHREKVRAENPNLPFQEITKLLAQTWSQLPQNEKQVKLNKSFVNITFWGNVIFQFQ